MKAVGCRKAGPITEPDALVDIELPVPEPGARDLLVEVKAVSVNPVDYKLRRSTPPEPGHEWRVLGWDAAGVVRAAGADVTEFAPGDEVYYAGTLNRTGTNAEYHCVDERIVGRKPATLDWAEAAALPLTSLTAWEALFDRLDVDTPVPGAAAAIVVIGGAGGVGSIAVQLLRQRTDLTVIATASRPKTQAWAASLGAHHVIDHTMPLAPQIEKLGLGAPGFVLSTTHTDRHHADIAELIAPRGRLCFIDDPDGFDIMRFKRKSVSVHLELMFTRSIYQTAGMAAQRDILNAVAALIDAGDIQTTLTERRAPINAENLKQVHAAIENGTARGKFVLDGF